VIIANAGKDATKIFKPLHPKNTLEDNADLLRKVGVVDPSGKFWTCVLNSPARS
jgi:L-lactate dehydrogenase (cytochrome)